MTTYPETSSATSHQESLASTAEWACSARYRRLPTDTQLVTDSNGSAIRARDCHSRRTRRGSAAGPGRMISHTSSAGRRCIAEESASSTGMGLRWASNDRLGCGWTQSSYLEQRNPVVPRRAQACRSTRDSRIGFARSMLSVISGAIASHSALSAALVSAEGRRSTKSTAELSVSLVLRILLPERAPRLMPQPPPRSPQSRVRLRGRRLVGGPRPARMPLEAALIDLAASRMGPQGVDKAQSSPHLQSRPQSKRVASGRSAPIQLSANRQGSTAVSCVAVTTAWRQQTT